MFCGDRCTEEYLCSQTLFIHILFIDNASVLHNYALLMHNYVNISTKNSSPNSGLTSNLLSNMQSNSQTRVTASVVGARGYTGLETTRLLLSHPNVELKACFATKEFQLSQYLSSAKAKSIPCYADSEIFNHLTDVVFLATPAEVSLELAPKLLKQGCHVIDLSGAFRLMKNDYQKWYGFEHTEKAWLNKSDYGLMPFASAIKNRATDNNSENNYNKSNTGHLIANPGCYATAISVALKPLLQQKILDPSWVIVDAKSGTTGAGKKASENLLFSEVDGECLPYKIAQHQHTPEILEALDTDGLNLQFCTHLLPTRRGIIASIYGRFLSTSSSKTSHTDNSTFANAELSSEQIMEKISLAYQEAFGNYPLIEFGPSKTHSHLLSLKKVVGTGKVHITFHVQGQNIYIFSCIDNLLKGAASQAIENFNRLYQLPVDTGLACEAII